MKEKHAEELQHFNVDPLIYIGNVNERDQLSQLLDRIGLV